MAKLPSDKIIGADNQQERLKMAYWIVGFVDGEGSFLISVFRNQTAKLGWQVFPEFIITQGAKSLSALEAIQTFFGCGKIYINKRYDNHHEHIYRYCVRKISNIKEKILPFFDQYQLKTMKRVDYDKFKQILIMMEQNLHLKPDGLKAIIKITQTMNRKKVSSLKSPETIR